MIGYQQPVIWGYADAAPLFLQTCSEVGEERDEFSPIRSRNKPPEGSTSDFFCFCLNMYIYICTTIYIRTNLLSISWATAGSPDWKALEAAKALTSWALT